MATLASHPFIACPEKEEPFLILVPLDVTESCLLPQSEVEKFTGEGLLCLARIGLIFFTKCWEGPHPGKQTELASGVFDTIKCHAYYIKWGYVIGLSRWQSGVDYSGSVSLLSYLTSLLLLQLFLCALHCFVKLSLSQLVQFRILIPIPPSLHTRGGTHRLTWSCVCGW